MSEREEEETERTRTGPRAPPVWVNTAGSTEFNLNSVPFNRVPFVSPCSPFSRIRLKTAVVGSVVYQSGTILACFFTVVIFLLPMYDHLKLCKSGAWSVYNAIDASFSLCLLIDSLDPLHVLCLIRCTTRDDFTS